MKKYGVPFCLALALAAMAGCGPAQSDVKGAAEDVAKAESASSLNLGIGTIAISKQTDTTASETGTVSTAGVYSTDPGTVGTQVQAGTQVAKVMAKTYVESAGKNGFLINLVSRVDSDKVTVGTTTNENASGVEKRGGYTMFEQDGWIRLEMGGDWPNALLGNPISDNDKSNGMALYPLAPKKGLYYTDGFGGVWLGGDAEVVAGAKTVKVQRQAVVSGILLADYYKKCFQETPVALGVDVNGLNTVACNAARNNGFSTNASETLSVGKPGSLKDVSHGERISLDHIRCGDALTGISSPIGSGNPLLTSCTKVIVLVGGKEVSDSVLEVTKLGKAKDLKAAPQMSDAE